MLAWIAKCLPPIVILIVSGALLFGSAGRDDAHITYWPAYTLANFGKIINYNGEKIEQSSSLLQVIIIGFSAKITGFDVINIGKLSSIFFGSLSIIWIFKFVAKNNNDSVAFSAALLTGTFPYFVYWSYGGLESTLAAFLGINLIISLSKYCNATPKASISSPILAIAFLEICRPESYLIIGCMLFSMFATQKTADKFKIKMDISPQRILELSISFLGISISLLAIRFFYFNSLFPQPVIAKYQGFSKTSIANGIQYFKNIFWLDPTITSIIVFCFIVFSFHQIKSHKPETSNIFSILYVITYTAFIIFSGGDWMEGGRFLVPLLPILLSFIPIAIKLLTSQKLALPISIFIIFIIEVNSTLQFAKKSSTGISFWSKTTLDKKIDLSEYSWFEQRNQVSVRDIPVVKYLNNIIPKLTNHYKRPITIMSGQMGMVSYHIATKNFGKIFFIDRRSLTDRLFTDCEVTQKLEKRRTGLWLNYDFFFYNIQSIQENCNLNKPDIIFDISEENERIVAKNGYTILYSQKGAIVNDAAWLRGERVSGAEFVAIRTGLWSLPN